MKYNPNTRPSSPKFPNFKRKNKMTKIFELLQKPIQKKRQNADSQQQSVWNFPAHNEGKKRIDFIYGGCKFYNSVNSIKANQRRAKNNVGIREPLAGPDHEITFNENETADLNKFSSSSTLFLENYPLMISKAYRLGFSTFNHL
ncbi:hypothetical protein F2Q69_00011008 [Brassica cretica]|uniref:Uncharacterized protein n=1 Tax=Brassica cretica TaxID=69181 RepID=A0A8S9R163_BRACR|nr:hypothetical protein F2Q69_00011008 [Brassica cretica]